MKDIKEGPYVCTGAICRLLAKNAVKISTAVPWQVFPPQDLAVAKTKAEQTNEHHDTYLKGFWDSQKRTKQKQKNSKKNHLNNKKRKKKKSRKRNEGFWSHGEVVCQWENSRLHTVLEINTNRFCMIWCRSTWSIIFCSNLRNICCTKQAAKPFSFLNRNEKHQKDEKKMCPFNTYEARPKKLRFPGWNFKNLVQAGRIFFKYPIFQTQSHIHMWA